MSSHITPTQIRAALGLMNWKQTDLAEATGLTPMTIHRILTESSKMQGKTEETIRRAFVERDVMFLPNNGVAMYPPTMVKLGGELAINELLDDVYETVKNGGSICVTGVDEALFDKYHQDPENAHAARMTAIGDKLDFRVILRAGDKNFAYSSYIHYRWMPEGKFRDNPFYVYGDKLAFIKVTAEGPEVWVFEMPSMAASFRDLFDVVWEQCAEPQV